MRKFIFSDGAATLLFENECIILESDGWIVLEKYVPSDYADVVPNVVRLIEKLEERDLPITKVAKMVSAHIDRQLERIALSWL